MSQWQDKRAVDSYNTTNVAKQYYIWLYCIIWFTLIDFFWALCHAVDVSEKIFRDRLVSETSIVKDVSRWVGLTLFWCCWHHVAWLGRSRPTMGSKDWSCQNHQAFHEDLKVSYSFCMGQAKFRHQGSLFTPALQASMFFDEVDHDHPGPLISNPCWCCRANHDHWWLLGTRLGPRDLAWLAGGDAVEQKRCLGEANISDGHIKLSRKLLDSSSSPVSLQCCILSLLSSSRSIDVYYNCTCIISIPQYLLVYISIVGGSNRKRSSVRYEHTQHWQLASADIIFDNICISSSSLNMGKLCQPIHFVRCSSYWCRSWSLHGALRHCGRFRLLCRSLSSLCHGNHCFWGVANWELGRIGWLFGSEWN